MSHPIVRRVLSSVVVLWAVLSITFVVHHALPSDPARAMAGPQARPAEVERVRQQLGLTRPLSAQYVSYFRHLLHLSSATRKDPEHRSCVSLGPVHLDLGMSYQRHQPVGVLLSERLPRTVLLAVTALTLQVVFGAAAGMVAALYHRRWLDQGTIVLTLLGVSAPTYVTGLLLQYWLAYRARWVPLDGYGTTALEHLHSLVLPALTLGLFGAAFYARVVRDEMLVLLKQDFMRTARAKGLTRARVILVHGLRNAMMPLVTVIGMDLGTMMGGAIVTEKLFRWPGMGSLAVDAVLGRDGPTVMGVVLVSSVAIVLSSLAVDLLYLWLDPRLRRPLGQS